MLQVYADKIKVKDKVFKMKISVCVTIFVIIAAYFENKKIGKNGEC